MRFQYDARKSRILKSNPKRGVSFDEALEILERPHYLDQRSENPEQFRAIGWVGEKLVSLIYEVHENEEGEYYRLITLWRSTREERKLYEENI